MQVTILFGSTGGTTEEVANKIAENLSYEAKIIDIANATVEDFNNTKNLILGTSTWGDGDLQDDWDDFFTNLDKIDFSNKKVALFGIGDQDSYEDTFLDGMGTLYEKVKEKGAVIVGDKVDVSSFDFEESTAVQDGSFVGLAIDEDNQEELSDERIKSWAENLNSSF